MRNLRVLFRSVEYAQEHLCEADSIEEDLLLAWLLVGGSDGAEPVYDNFSDSLSLCHAHDGESVENLW